MPTTVEITVSDDGKVSVGLTDTPSDPQSMQPAGSVAEAFAMAKHILQSNGQQAPAPGSGPGAALDKSGAMSDGSTVQNDNTAAGDGPPAASSDSSSASDPRAIWNELAQQAIPRH